MIGRVALDTQFRRQDPPADTAAHDLYKIPVAREYDTYHRVLASANKPSEHNAFNMPLTPAMLVAEFPKQQHSLQTFRLLSRPIKLLGIGSGG